MLHTQVEAWNRGDVTAFMAPYWQSEQLTFASGGEVTRGYEATLERYRKRYPDQEAMGKLTFGELELHALGPQSARVLGTWRLERKAEPIEGRFTLIWQKFPEGWRIIHDHTSLVEVK